MVGRTLPTIHGEIQLKDSIRKNYECDQLGLPVCRHDVAAQSLKRITNANNLNAVCESTKQSYKVITSLQPPVQLLTTIASCLELKGEPFSVFEGASDGEMEAFWEVVHLVDDRLYQSDTS